MNRFILFPANVTLKQCQSLQQYEGKELHAGLLLYQKLRSGSAKICILRHPDRLYPEIKLCGCNLLSGSGHILN